MTIKQHLPSWRVLLAAFVCAAFLLAAYGSLVPAGAQGRNGNNGGGQGQRQGGRGQGQGQGGGGGRPIHFHVGQITVRHDQPRGGHGGDHH